MFPHTKLYPSSEASADPRHKRNRKPSSWTKESIRKDPGWFQGITTAKMNLFQGFLHIFTRGENKCGRRGMFYKSENIHRFLCRGLHLSQNAADLTIKQSYLSPHLSLYGFINSSLCHLCFSPSIFIFGNQEILCILAVFCSIVCMSLLEISPSFKGLLCWFCWELHGICFCAKISAWWMPNVFGSLVQCYLPFTSSSKVKIKYNAFVFERVTRLLRCNGWFPFCCFQMR